MIGEIEQQRSTLAALCRHYRVRKLRLFGSTATGAFVPTRTFRTIAGVRLILPAEERQPRLHPLYVVAVYFAAPETELDARA